MAIAPTLILGLGGTGSQIVEKVSEKVHESGSDQGERIAYCVFDTDANDLRSISQTHPELYTVQTSTNSGVGDYLSINPNARDAWFPINALMNRKSLTEGAAQVRAISRLAFETTLKSAHLGQLHRAIEKLFRIDKDQEEQSLRVIITSSLAGGTGSGLILPVAFYLAQYLKAKYPKAKAITRGFFIQPDVFYKVINGSEEQKNLQVNAYAAVRELDAFLMKGDHTLPPQYKNLKFEFPKIGAEGVEEIDAMPYDFCFLFDANNTSGGSLDAFASYLDHAATCIYTLAIGPMSRKSNSREDNVLREIIKNNGRNRYAGAGASRLVYPWQHVRDVVGETWASQVLSDQWLKFDSAFEERSKALAKQREEGLLVRDIDRGAEFIATVESLADQKDPFAKAVMNQTLVFDKDGVQSIGNQWDAYIKALQEYVGRPDPTFNDSQKEESLRSAVNDLRDKVDGNEYATVYSDLCKYMIRARQDADDRSGIIAYTMFKSDSDKNIVLGNMPAHKLEAYMVEPVSKNFMHPVSCRYFLYKTLEKLTELQKGVQSKLEGGEGLENYFDTFEQVFDDPGTEEVEKAGNLADRKKTWGERITRKPSEAKLEIVSAMGTYIDNVAELRNNLVLQKIVAGAMDYVRSVISAFETFFDSLKGDVKKLSTKLQQDLTRYDGLTGSTTRYVFADSQCLKKVISNTPYKGSVNSIDSQLALNIYNQVRHYAMLTDEKGESYFRDLYNNVILGYFSDQVMQLNAGQIKIDVIEALENECRVLRKNYEEEFIRHYVIDEIDKVKRLASPFIEQPLGENRHPIEACAYNGALEGDADPKRKSLIMEALGNYGGQKDKDISKQEILFYNAIYGIRAQDLSKFAPALRDLTTNRPAGEYFTSYYQMVSQIKPTVGETKVITPHIDRRWHSISELPDLDEDNQARQLKEIHKALLLGIIYGRIKWTHSVYGDTKIYRYKPAKGGLVEDFIVSNGTPCDQFYEVIDALTNNPVAVREILDYADHSRKREMQKMAVATFEATELDQQIDAGINLEQLKIDFGAEFKDLKASIFDVVAFYALSTPSDEYIESLLYAFSKNLVEYLEEEVTSLSSSDEAHNKIDSLFTKQLQVFRSNIKGYLSAAGQPFAAKLSVVVSPFITFAEENEYEQSLACAKEIDSDLDRLN